MLCLIPLHRPEKAKATQLIEDCQDILDLDTLRPGEISQSIILDGLLSLAKNPGSLFQPVWRLLRLTLERLPGTSSQLTSLWALQGCNVSKARSRLPALD